MTGPATSFLLYCIVYPNLWSTSFKKLNAAPARPLELRSSSSFCRVLRVLHGTGQSQTNGLVKPALHCLGWAVIYHLGTNLNPCPIVCVCLSVYVPAMRVYFPTTAPWPAYLPCHWPPATTTAAPHTEEQQQQQQQPSCFHSPSDSSVQPTVTKTEQKNNKL